MKKTPYIIIFFITIIFAFIPSYAYGDIGPKPSVVVSFNGLEGEDYFVTLLSETSSTGPYSAFGKFQGDRRYNKDDDDYEIWQKFVDYEDKDGYYFLQYFEDCTKTSQFKWGYRSPQKFKILVYFPNLDSFAVSKIYEQYAFDSYFKADAADIELLPSSVIEGMKVKTDYNYTWEIISLIIRIIATLAIEVLIALFFGYRHKNQLRIILKTNIITQVILNIILNTVNYFLGSLAFVLIYFLAEVIVFIIEASIYSNLLTKQSSGRLAKKVYAVLYSLAANAVSYFLGYQLAKIIPGIF